MSPRRLIIFILAALPLFIWAVSPAGENSDTHISTRYFGPNAFPIPDMLDGRVCPDLKVELAGDWYKGFDNDHTADAFFRLYIPLFTRRVNLTVWMPIQEWYWISPERQRSTEMTNPDSTTIQGHGAGDVYIATDIQVLRERKWWPSIAVRAAMKTASGGEYNLRRHYDAPAYWFDASVGKSLYVHDVELRLAANAGFLCWQTTTSSQNDAVLYGVQMLVGWKYLSGRCTFSGYQGWEKHGGDKPMSIKAEVRGHIKDFEPFVYYQYGIQDFPFHQLRVGLAYHIDIIGRAKELKAKKHTPSTE